MTIPIQEHGIEIEKNMRLWNKKPLLRRIYFDFYRIIARHIPQEKKGLIVEIGSGTGNIREVIPACLRTDLFPNPWVDKVENAYGLSFPDSSVAVMILFDVFHHLRYPGTALDEFHRVLVPGGRIIIFDPFISITGEIVYGLFHHEPIGNSKKIEWFAPERWRPEHDTYYASQGNVTRVFFGKEFASFLHQWRIVARELFAAFSYIASGGYSGPQLYPQCFYPLAKAADKILNALPRLFATRSLVVLEKKG
jgi:SAM-dependent methyltransferase